MTAPKIYVPSPGRPPEWVVDLMVEGRVNFQTSCEVAGSWWAYASRPTGVEECWRLCGEHQAIRLNEDGSLEIIDAPCEHDWYQKQHATFAIGRKSVTRRILRCEKCGQEKYEVTKDAPEPTFTKSEVVEALVEEARKSDSILTGVSGRVAAERIAEVLGILSEYRKERCK